MSFVGGGTDLPSHYLRYGGAVVSTAIDKYINVVVNTKFDDSIRIGYSRTEICKTVDEVQHPIVRECLRLLGISKRIEIVSLADIPASGTGLGSSSSFAVGLLHALHAHLGNVPTRSELGRDACRIEIDICGEPIGKQDQYAAAFGGLNFIRFNRDNTVEVEPLGCADDVQGRIESCTLAFYTGIERSASAILEEQNRQIETGRKTEALRHMCDQAYQLRDELRRGNADAVGVLMHDGWTLKKSISDKVSSGDIDTWYEAGREAGALGGKLLGAGGGGFLVFYAEPQKHDAIRRALAGLRPVTFRLDRNGSGIVFHDGVGKA